MASSRTNKDNTRSRRPNPRGHQNDSPDVVMSKRLSWILRHGAEKEGLAIRSDGFVKVSDLLARPQFSRLDFPTLQKIVNDNDKQRYQLTFEPETAGAPAEAGHEPPGVWWIRANQGHTLKVESLEVKEVVDPAELPIAVHGTTYQAWRSIAKEGLSRMKRNHVHLATGLLGTDGVISGMRKSSQVLIYIDVSKAMAAGLKFSFSANNVVLTAGNEDGFIKPDLFSKVEAADGRVARQQDDGTWSNTWERALDVWTGHH